MTLLKKYEIPDQDSTSCVKDISQIQEATTQDQTTIEDPSTVDVQIFQMPFKVKGVMLDNDYKRCPSDQKSTLTSTPKEQLSIEESHGKSSTSQRRKSIFSARAPTNMLQLKDHLNTFIEHKKVLGKIVHSRRSLKIKRNKTKPQRASLRFMHVLDR